MKYLLVGALLLAAGRAWAWDGFDADSADLVRIEPDRTPAPGETISVKNYDSRETVSAIVKSVKRNRRTIEVVVLYPDNTSRTLVMEGR